MDWRYLLVIALVIALNVWQSQDRRHATPRRPLPDYVPETEPIKPGPLPGPSVFDPEIRVHLGAEKRSSYGTAFALDAEGWWMSARHVVDHCQAIQLRFPQGPVVQVAKTVQLPDADLSLLLTRRTSRGLSIGTGPLSLGQSGFLVGYPQGVEGEVWGILMGRMRMRVSGRYSTNEPILAWAEKTRRPSWLKRLGGLSGGPALDSASRVIGVVVAESRRRGRVYTAAPMSVKRLLPRVSGSDGTSSSISPATLRARADTLRRNYLVANVVCIAELQRYAGD